MKGKHNNSPCNIHNDMPGNNYMLLILNLLPPLEVLWGTKPEHENNHTPPYSAQVKNVWHFTSTPSCAYVV